MSFTYPLHDMLPNVIQNILRANIHLSIPFVEEQQLRDSIFHR